MLETSSSPTVGAVGMSLGLAVLSSERRLSGLCALLLKLRSQRELKPQGAPL